MIPNKITLLNKELIDSIDDTKLETREDVENYKSALESLNDLGIGESFKEIKDINKISFGHFILIEKILELDIEIDNKLKMLMPILIRPANEYKLDNDNEAKEKAHEKKVINIGIGSIYGSFNRFMKLRDEYLYKTYNGVIYAPKKDEEDEDEEDEEGTNINSSQSARSFHIKRFFWQSLISKVANNDIFRFNDTVELMMFTVMPYLAEKRSLEIVENLEFKASNI